MVLRAGSWPSLHSSVLLQVQQHTSASDFQEKGGVRQAHSTLGTWHPPATFDESIFHTAPWDLKIPSGFSPLPLFYPGYPPTARHLAFMLRGGLRPVGADASCLGGFCCWLHPGSGRAIIRFLGSLPCVYGLGPAEIN